MRLQLSTLAAALALISTPALAADEGFYVGAGAGIFSADLGDIAPGIGFDEDDTGFRGFGGWQFHNNFAVELGYVDGGKASATIGDIDLIGIEADLDISVSGFDLSLVGSLPLGETFFAFGRAGVIKWDADLDAVLREDDGEGGVITTSESASESGEDLMYGAGFGMNLGDNAEVRLEYTFYDLSDVDGDFISASFVWRFN